jgi:predicted ArsR family transcriptional regulator
MGRKGRRMTTRPKGITDDTIIATVKALTKEQGGASYRTLAKALGYQSATAVRYRIVRLATEGKVQREPGAAGRVTA